ELHFPVDPRRPVAARGPNVPTVWAVGHAVRKRSVATQGERFPARRRVPHMNSSVPTCDHALTIRAERHTVVPSRQHAEGTAGGVFPAFALPNRLLPSFPDFPCGGDTPTIGTEDDPPDYPLVRFLPRTQQLTRRYVPELDGTIGPGGRELLTIRTKC